VFSLILEFFEMKNKLHFELISQDETFNLIDKYKFTILDGIDRLKDIPDFYTTNHYKIMVGDVFAGIIDFNNFYDTWKDVSEIFPEYEQYLIQIQDNFYDTWNDIPGMSPESGHGKHSIWVQMLEIRKEAREKIGSPLAIIKGVFDYLCDYCKENGFKSILCGAKTERIEKMYKHVGFIGRKDFLVYLIK
jgi:hypothetical protein